MLKVIVKKSRNIKKLFTPRVYEQFAKAVTQSIRRNFVQHTPVDTMLAKKSWTPVQRTSKGYSFGNTQMYSKFLITGSKMGSLPWPSPGPRTLLVAGNVYSSQAPGGIQKQFNVQAVVNNAMNTFISGLR